MVTRSGNAVTIDDVVAVKPGKGCKKVDKTKVRCTTRKAPTRVRVYLGARNDSVVNRTDLPMTAGGGDGNDRITGGPRADSLTGDDGNDQIWGGAAADRLDGGLGADRLHGGAGADSLHGGCGNDYLYGEAGEDALSGDQGNDKEYGGADSDRIYLNPIPFSTTGADLISGGGSNAAEKGENCWTGEGDVAVNCEYAELYWPAQVPGLISLAALPRTPPGHDLRGLARHRRAIAADG